MRTTRDWTVPVVVLFIVVLIGLDTDNPSLSRAQTCCLETGGPIPTLSPLGLSLDLVRV